MSIKESCDQKSYFYTSLFSFSFNTRSDVPRKRLNSVRIEKKIIIMPKSITNMQYNNNLNNICTYKNINSVKYCYYCIFHIILLILFSKSTANFVRPTNALLIIEPPTLSDGISTIENSEQQKASNRAEMIKGSDSVTNNDGSNIGNSNNIGLIANSISSTNSNIGGRYLDKLDNLERSLAAVLIKVAYGTTSTTKRSIPDNSYVPILTTIATPPLTTLRYSEKASHQHQINLHHRNYELDLERDHALPTSAPNADILKSNSNPIYPNPNRHHDRDRHRHVINSTPATSRQPTLPMYPGEIPSYSPPARAFFTPPEYQNHFADKPTLRGTNNDGGILNSSGGLSSAVNAGAGSNSGSSSLYINRRPIPPPSLMPGHERIPFRPPDLNIGNVGQSLGEFGSRGVTVGNGLSFYNNNNPIDSDKDVKDDQLQQQRKALNTPSQKMPQKVDSYDDDLSNKNNANSSIGNTVGDSVNKKRIHIPNISRILSGSNGKKEEIPDVLLKHVTNRPNTASIKSDTLSNKNDENKNYTSPLSTIYQNRETNHNPIQQQQSSEEDSDEDIDFSDLYKLQEQNNQNQDEPKSQLTIKMSSESTENPHNHIYGNNGKNILPLSTSSIEHESVVASDAVPSLNKQESSNQENGSKSGSNEGKATSASTTAASTWGVAWNIHVYLSVILFTILGVYSIFKVIFYDKLTHLFNQSYFICIHLILISICIARIFYLIYDAYNIHLSFNILISELFLNLPGTFLTISFSVLMLFLLIRSLNHKNNRYSALIRPLTIVVGSSVHVGLCITLHYVENYTTNNLHHHYYYQQQQQLLFRSGGNSDVSNSNIVNNIVRPILPIQPSPPPRVLSLICQIIYIFVCLSLGLLYLYIYRVLKRVLRSKSQNYIHGYQNLSYAIHITIATALLFVLLATLQIFGAISISTTRSIHTNGSSEIDWLQWGYQFSLRLIEIAIIWLIGWVAGLKTGGGGSALGVGNSALQREKAGGSSSNDNHNASGFALFPCTSSSSQEHFETDYPAICNTNTNLHTYTKRTGKLIYDDNFTLNSLQGGNSSCGAQNMQTPNVNAQRGVILPNNDFHQLKNSTEFFRSYETSSLRSAASATAQHHYQLQHHHQHLDSDMIGSDIIDSAAIDHYENPNFELRGSKISHHYQQQQRQVDNCYSEPLNAPVSSSSVSTAGHKNNQLLNTNYDQGHDFQNFERPNFQDRPHSRSAGNSTDYYHQHNIANENKMSKHLSKLDRLNYDNSECRSSNSNHSCASGHRGGGYPSYNSFERRNSGVRKSGTLNNINGAIHGRNGSSSSSSSVSNQQQHKNNYLNQRSSGVQTLSSGRRGNSGRNGNQNHQQYRIPFEDDIKLVAKSPNVERSNSISGNDSISDGTTNTAINCINGDGINNSINGKDLHDLQNMDTSGVINSGSSSGESANSGSMLVAEHGFVRFRALDDINNAQGVGIHNASIRTTDRSKEKRFTNNT